MTGTMKVSSSYDWSELPSELLSIIACKLSSAFDFIRFRSACRSWRTGADPVDIPPSPPLLLLPHDPSSAKRTFFSLATRTSRTFHHLEELRSKTVCGSAYGWLALTTHPRTPILSLWNPLTGAHIPLPPLHRPLLYPLKSFIPGKVFLSSKPKPPDDVDDRDDCVLVITNDLFQGLALCRPGDKAWTFLDDVGLREYPSSIVFHKGRCFVFDRGGTGVVLDLAPGCPTVVVSRETIPRVPPGLGDVGYPYFGFEPCFSDGSFALNTNTGRGDEEEMFVVVHRGFLNGFATSEPPASSLEHVRFFKLENPRGGVLGWAEVDNVGNSLAVFVSWNHTSVFDIGLAGSNSQGCLENCIYFSTTHLYDHTMRHPRGGVIFMDILGMMIGDTHHILEAAAATATAAAVSSSVYSSKYEHGKNFDRYGEPLDNSTWFTPTF